MTMALEDSTRVGGLSADEFFQQAQHPDFLDEMLFQVKAVNPENEGTFSREGVNDTVDLIDAFITARIFGQWRKTGKPPKAMKMHLKIEWEYDPDIREGLLPYFDADIAPGLTQLDSERRLPRKRVDS
jgi:hypothetical protein